MKLVLDPMGAQKRGPVRFIVMSSSVVGSIINANFYRVFKQDSYRPAPFKVKNMSLNNYALVDDLQVGWAQVL